MLIILAIVIAILLSLIFIFSSYPTMDSDQLMAEYRRMSQFLTRPVMVEEVQHVVEQFYDTADSIVNGSVPVKPAGPSNSTALVAGKYYFHQSSKQGCACNTHGIWSTATWGSGGDTSHFASNGCAVYSLAMAVSNLRQKEVNPLTILIGLGCEVISSDASSAKIDTSKSNCFSDVAIYRERSLQQLCQLYDLSYTKVDNEVLASAELSSGAVLWACVKGSKWNTTSNTHFVAIYATDGVSYYAYDSSNLNYMSNPESVNLFWDRYVNGPVFAIKRS